MHVYIGWMAYLSCPSACETAALVTGKPDTNVCDIKINLIDKCEM